MTSNTPAVEYVIIGFCALEVDGFPPGNTQAHEVGPFVDSSVNWTFEPVHTDVSGTENAVIGGNPFPQSPKQPPDTRDEILFEIELIDVVDQEDVLCTTGAMI